MTTQLEKQVTGDKNLLALSEIKGYANARDFKIGEWEENGVLKHALNHLEKIFSTCIYDVTTSKWLA